MTKQSLTQVQRKSPVVSSLSKGSILQRKCTSCGQHTDAEECQTCTKKRLSRHNSIAPSQSSYSLPLNSTSNSGFTQDFSRIRVSNDLQAKLIVSKSDDIYEQEADRIAEEVVSTANSTPKLQPTAIFTNTIQKQEDISQNSEVEEEGVPENDLDLGALEENEENEEGIIGDETGRPKLESNASRPTKNSTIHLPSGTGQPLDTGVRQFMEQKIGHDFSQVHIHTGADAVESARQINAQAYTFKTDIFFNQGRYQPTSTAGLKLLAHELTHVVQQTGSASENSRVQSKIQRQVIQAKRPRRADPPRRPTRRRREEAPACKGPCAPSKSALHRSGCSKGSPPDTNNFLRHIHVSRAAHSLVAEYGSNDRSIAATKTVSMACSPSTRSGPHGKVPTPLGDTKVDKKCDGCYTNKHRDGMAWFTNFQSHGSIGFHNSQLVGTSHESHGCVRVSCGNAQIINRDTWSGNTTIHVDP